jgi:hypothetical protein
VESPETEEEALCLLKLAYARHTICEVIKKLVEHQLKESVIHSWLLDIQAWKAQKNLAAADIRVGQVCSTVHQSGYSVYMEEHLHCAQGRFESEYFIYLSSSILYLNVHGCACPSSNSQFSHFCSCSGLMIAAIQVIILECSRSVESWPCVM